MEPLPDGSLQRTIWHVRLAVWIKNLKKEIDEFTLKMNKPNQISSWMSKLLQDWVFKKKHECASPKAVLTLSSLCRTGSTQTSTWFNGALNVYFPKIDKCKCIILRWHHFNQCVPRCLTCELHNFTQCTFKLCFNLWVGFYFSICNLCIYGKRVNPSPQRMSVHAKQFIQMGTYVKAQCCHPLWSKWEPAEGRGGWTWSHGAQSQIPVQVWLPWEEQTATVRLHGWRANGDVL